MMMLNIPKKKEESVLGKIWRSISPSSKKDNSNRKVRNLESQTTFKPERKVNKVKVSSGFTSHGMEKLNNKKFSVSPVNPNFTKVPEEKKEKSKSPNARV